LVQTTTDSSTPCSSPSIFTPTKKLKIFLWKRSTIKKVLKRYLIAISLRAVYLCEVFEAFAHGGKEKTPEQTIKRWPEEIDFGGREKDGSRPKNAFVGDWWRNWWRNIKFYENDISKILYIRSAFVC
jgi:hypothetical protein